MEQDLLQVFLSKDKMCVMRCPHCRHSQEIGVNELSSGLANLFLCDCPCGKRFGVQLVGFRTSQRKAVKLVGCLVLGSTLAKVQMPCTVRDISVKGMCISTGQIKHLSQDADLHASVLLDDRTQTRLKLPCKVRHLRRDTAGVILGVEFLAVEPGQAQAIGSYLTT